MTLSKRLRAIADLVPPGSRVCDVGTDHAYLPIALMQSGRAARVTATDIREAPLANAARNIGEAGVSGIETRLCDGLCGIPLNETDAVVIAGMGGEVIAGILSRAAQNDLLAPLFLLQPTTSAEVLRQYLCENGFLLQSETAVSENGKLYTVMAARFTGKSQKMPPYFYYIGLIDPNTADGRRYIEKQYARLSKCAAALEKVPAKQREYLALRDHCLQIGRILTENGET